MTARALSRWYRSTTLYGGGATGYATKQLQSATPLGLLNAPRRCAPASAGASLSHLTAAKKAVEHGCPHLSNSYACAKIWDGQLP